MGWSIGFDEKWQRDIGYGVPAQCDQPGCTAEIDRGLAYVCGSEPMGGDHGCGLYFCDLHKHWSERRDGAELCKRCYGGRWGNYAAKPDVPQWVSHKLTDESWQQWRDENPDWVQKHRP